MVTVLTLTAQHATLSIPQNARPKLVVGIVIDQMRWDYLYRYYDRFTEGGFKRLMKNGFEFTNAMIPYTPTVTAAGHTCIYTGSVPAIHGITGNNFYDYTLNRRLYCSEDNTVQTVGASDNLGQMSPRNMLVTTVCDELKLATNFKSKVIGIALKDRGAILPAGHSADAAYWYDHKNGRFISSTFYMKALPGWAIDFNAAAIADSYYQKNWTTLYPVATYIESDADTNAYEGMPFGVEQKQFPYHLAAFAGKDYGAIRYTPYGNSLTVDFAEAAVRGEQLGAHAETDFLAVSFSSTDYIGHAFGPNSVEAEDAYLRLDKDLASFFQFLDAKIGADKYTVFLSADHGVAHVPGFMHTHRLPAGFINFNAMQKKLNEYLKSIFSEDSLFLLAENYQLYLNRRRIADKKLDRQKVMDACTAFLLQQEGIDRVIDYARMSDAVLPEEVKKLYINGYNPQRCGDIVVILKSGYIEDYNGKGTTHGLWNPYDAHIPLLFYGYGIHKGKSYEKVYMTDIAPTIAALLHIQMPSGCIGSVLKEALK
jgi:predicted AlkP superfamily pyrophosphatase or phosphodiesterase